MSIFKFCNLMKKTKQIYTGYDCSVNMLLGRSQRNA